MLDLVLDLDRPVVLPPPPAKPPTAMDLLTKVSVAGGGGHRGSMGGGGQSSLRGRPVGGRYWQFILYRCLVSQLSWHGARGEQPRQQWRQNHRPPGAKIGKGPHARQGVQLPAPASPHCPAAQDCDTCQ